MRVFDVATESSWAVFIIAYTIFPALGRIWVTLFFVIVAPITALNVFYIRDKKLDKPWRENIHWIAIKIGIILFAVLFSWTWNLHFR